MNGQVEFKAEGLGDGGHAFPQPGVYDASRDQVNPVGAYYDAGGMTLRDFFAAQALPIVSAMSWRELEFKPVDGLSIMENNARCAYQQADAMLKARAAS